MPKTPQIAIPFDLHKKLKLQAVQEGRKLQALVAELLAAALKNRKAAA